MAEHTRATVLGIRGNPQVGGYAGDGLHHAACPRVLHEAALACDDAVRPRGVETVVQPAALAWGKWRCCLISVREGLVHAADVVDCGAVGFGHLGKQLAHLLALAAQLYGVGDREPLAASAFPRDRACVRLVSHASSVARATRARSRRPAAATAVPLQPPCRCNRRAAPAVVPPRSKLYPLQKTVRPAVNCTSATVQLPPTGTVLPRAAWVCPDDTSLPRPRNHANVHVCTDFATKYLEFCKRISDSGIHNEDVVAEC